jgi:hypothetical protein
MPNHFSASDMITIDRDNRSMATSGSPGPMSAILENLYDEIATGAIGIQSLPGDIDSLALGGGEFSQDLNTAPAGGTLLFAWLASRFLLNGLSIVNVSAGSLTLAASQTKYVECDRTGAVPINTSGFTNGRLPLWIVVTGSGSWTQVNVTSKKCHLGLIGLASIAGSQLSAAGQQKEISGQFGSVAATGSFLLMAPNVASILSAAVFTESAAISASDTDYWTFSLTNLGQAGAGSTAMLAATAANTTKATGGSALVSNGNRSLTLHGTPGVDANLNCAANDVIQVTFTKTGAPGILFATSLRLDFQFAT